MIRFAALFTMLCSVNTNAADLILSGGLDYSAPSDIRDGGDQHWTGTAGGVAGLTIDAPFSEIPFSFETGFFLRNSRSERSAQGIISTSEGSWTDIPLLIHYHFDEHLSIGTGGYFSFFRSGNSVSGPESPDAGMILDVRAALRAFDPVSLIVDARYLHGLSNLSSNPGDTYHSRSVQILLGVSYPLL
jgi:hypothetical protein